MSTREEMSGPRQTRRDPPCQVGCPNGTDIRGWINTIAQRHKTGLSREEAYRRAWEIIVDVNPFPSTLGRVCPHPCEHQCNRHEKDGSVAINALERFIGDRALASDWPLARLEEDPKPESVGVVGAGPAGLSFAYQMARRGYEVTVYERAPRAGGMLRYGIPGYRLPDAIVDGEIKRITDLGVTLKLSTGIGSEIDSAALQDRHDVIFLGIGAQLGQKLRIKGEDGPGVLTGTAYLGRINSGERVELGREVAVIGGGNTAVDAARTALRYGSEVTIYYRRTREEMPATAEELEEALAEGVKIAYLTAPVEVRRQSGRVVGLVVQQMELGEVDAGGRRKPVGVAGSERMVSVEAVITAVSQKADWDHLEDLQRQCATPGPGGSRALVWQGGDVLQIGIAGSAIAQGRHAAESVHAGLRGMPAPTAEPAMPITADHLHLEYYQDRERTVLPHLEIEAALHDPAAEVHPGITEAQFLEEVTRCLSCGECFGCQHCWMYCSASCFSRVEEAGPGAYFTVTLDQCVECGKCIDLCPCGYLEPASPSENSSPSRDQG